MSLWRIARLLMVTNFPRSNGYVPATCDPRGRSPASAVEGIETGSDPRGGRTDMCGGRSPASAVEGIETSSRKAPDRRGPFWSRSPASAVEGIETERLHDLLGVLPLRRSPASAVEGIETLP